MPHVRTAFQFFKPCPEDYLKWEKKLDRDGGWKVSKSTIVCSNHFRHGKPLHTNKTPELYLRGYPYWAKTVSEVHSMMKDLEEDSCAPILREICPTIHFTPAHMILTGITLVMPPILPPDILNVCTTAPKVNAPDLLSGIICHLHPKCQKFILGQVHEHCLPGDAHGALVKHKIAPGVEFFSANTPDIPVTPVSSRKCPIATITTPTQKTSSTSSRRRLHASPGLPPSNEVTLSPEVLPLEMPEVAEISDSKMHPSPTTVKAKKKKICTKVSCTANRRIQDNLATRIRTLSKKNSRQATELHAEREKFRILNDKYKTLQKELDDARVEIDKNKHFTIDRISHSDELVNLHTGLPGMAHFQYILRVVQEPASNMQYWRGDSKSSTTKEYQIKNQQKPGRKKHLSLSNELLLTLMRLRLNLTESYLAFLFGVRDTCVSQVLSTWIVFLSHELGPLVYWPTSEEVAVDVPKCFRKWHGRVRAIIDCTEVPLCQPSLAEANTKTFSSYKNRTTVKYLIACTPRGIISYVSEPAGGKMSDQAMVEKTGICRLFSFGDICMADKGFRIRHLLMEYGADLVMPPFTKKGKQFTTGKAMANKEIANARIHIERVIGRMKDYKIFQGPLPIDLKDLAGPIGLVIGALVNLNKPIVPPD